jgi:hypothetical protein
LFYFDVLTEVLNGNSVLKEYVRKRMPKNVQIEKEMEENP